MRASSQLVCARHAPLYMQIALLPHDDAGNRLCARVIEDLVVDRLHHLEAGTQRDRVDEDVAVDANGMA